jgi:hypothetical protein
MRAGASVLHGEGECAVPAQLAPSEGAELTGVDSAVEPVAVGVSTGVLLPTGVPLAGVLLAVVLLAAADGVGVLGGWARWAVTVRVTVWTAVTVLVGPATVAVTVAAVRPRTGRDTGAVIEWVEAAGSEWPAPPITMPATSPAAAASVTGRRHQFRDGSVPNMAS